MQRRYNLALRPTQKSSQFIQLANPFKSYADQYILGDASYPHVTLHQFMATERELDNVKQTMQTLASLRLTLTFTEFSFGNYSSAVNWLSLVPKEYDVLVGLHHQVARFIPNSITKKYDPHLTLMNTLASYAEIEPTLFEIGEVNVKDEFAVLLGLSDDVGQVVERIIDYGSQSGF